MPVSEEYREFVLGQLDTLGPIRARNMFGGVGLYYEGLFFAIIADNTLYFKVDDSNREDFEAESMEPFKPFEEKPYTMNYYEIPIEILEDMDDLNQWALKSLEVARKKRSVKKSKL